MIQVEHYAQGNLMSRTSVELGRLFLPSDEQCWFPMFGKIESFTRVDADKKIRFERSAQSTETYKVMQGTIKVNTRPSDQTFKVKYRVGTPISDQLKDVQYEFGQQKANDPTREEQGRMLDEQLKIADRQRDELRASSWSRRGWSWSDTLPSTVGALCLLAGFSIWLTRRIRRT
ncbi:MAG: hypothetical protein ACP5XB_13930 [Isosphaeraceae bacterium]